MSSIAPINTPPGGALPASTPGAGALSRPLSGAPSAEAVRQPDDIKAEQAEAQASRKPSGSELQKQIEQMLAESRVQTSLRFRVDEDADRIVVSVVDSDTGETIVQIPDEAALAVARRLAATGSGLLDRQA